MQPSPPSPIAPPTLQSVTLPAPIGGLNTVDAGASMPTTDCVLLYNMIAAEYGLRARLGYREWATGFDGPVLTLIPFTGSSPSQNKIFATTATGIYDCTDSTALPLPAITFPSTSDGAGVGVSTVFVNFGGNHFCLYCDEENGYFVYSESGSSWTQVAYGSGAGQVREKLPTPPATTPVYPTLNPKNLCFVMVWASRVWFVEKNTGWAWYTALGSLYGDLTPFYFGTQFRVGGDLRGLYNWTIDGGSGVTNSLVAVSGGGDVVIYQGYDPDTAGAFSLKAVWFCGGVPAGRRIATNFGGDMLVLSMLGLVPISKLTQGNPVFDRSQYATHKIANLFNQLVYAGKDLPGWHVSMSPQDNALIVNVPQPSGITIQLVMSMATKGWSQYRDLPNIIHSSAHDGDLYFTTDDNRVCVFKDYLDAVPLDGSSFSPVQWEVLSSFQNLGSARKKRVSMLRPTFVTTGGQAQYACEARFGYDFTELPGTVVPGLLTNGQNSDFVFTYPLTYADQIFVDRLLQIPLVDYTVAGNVLTFLAGAIPDVGSTISVLTEAQQGLRVSNPAVGSGFIGGGSTWDSAVWDANTFTGEMAPSQNVFGCDGIGQDVAIILRGAANSRTSLVGIDVFFEIAGYL